MVGLCSASFSDLMYRYVQRYNLQIIHTLYNSIPSIWYHTYLLIQYQQVMENQNTLD